ncbi:unnamed protein product [Peronospora belbahrii]|uniref:Reverse transcriptase domain-containing protein n=1 Tax=Peronospora belbahrii TaxID=622444 RepID=A0ABN8CKH3_9STRA|nr:unnamed protein product [Peronospora belbahrii]
MDLSPHLSAANFRQGGCSGYRNGMQMILPTRQFATGACLQVPDAESSRHNASRADGGGLPEEAPRPVTFGKTARVPLSFSLSGGESRVWRSTGYSAPWFTVPGRPDRAHIVSAFVDDFTIFLCHTKQIRPALNLANWFGHLSGLQVQPNKSQSVILDTAMTQPTIRVSSSKEKTPKSKPEVTYANYATYIRRNYSTNCIHFPNTIVLSRVLFTAVVFTGLGS